MRIFQSVKGFSEALVLAALFATVVGGASISNSTNSAASVQAILVQGRDIDGVVRAVESVGGEVSETFMHLRGVGAELTSEQLIDLAKDTAVTRIRPLETASIDMTAGNYWIQNSVASTWWDLVGKKKVVASTSTWWEWANKDRSTWWLKREADVQIEGDAVASTWWLKNSEKAKPEDEKSTWWEFASPDVTV